MHCMLLVFGVGVGVEGTSEPVGALASLRRLAWIGRWFITYEHISPTPAHDDDSTFAPAQRHCPFFFSQTVVAEGQRT